MRGGCHSPLRVYMGQQKFKVGQRVVIRSNMHSLDGHSGVVTGCTESRWNRFYAVRTASNGMTVAYERSLVPIKARCLAGTGSDRSGMEVKHDRET